MLQEALKHPSQAMLGEVVPRILHIWGGDAWMMMCVGGEASVYRGWAVTEVKLVCTEDGRSQCWARVVLEGRPTLGLLFTHSKGCMNSAGHGWSPQKTLLSTVYPLNLYIYSWTGVCAEP